MGAVMLTLSGCMVGPDYRQVKLQMPTGYKEAAGWVKAAPEDNALKGDWWTAFNDPILNTLEPQVAVNNATLAADYDAYQQAAQLVQEVRGTLFPTVGITSSFTRAGSGGGSVRASTGGAISASRGPQSSGTFEGSVSWTPDIWGKIRRQVQSDVNAAQVSAADLANARLSAQGLLATDYVDLRGSDALISLLQKTVAADEASLKIAQNQTNAGTVTPADLITARTQLEGAQAQLVNAGVARAQFEHAIAVLVGRVPSELTIAPGQLMRDVPVAPLAVPSVLLQRRPDIAASERLMAEQNALIGVAVGAYYPNLSLSALGGYSADPIGGLFNVANSLWSLGASISGNLFEGGTRSASVLAAEFAYDQSVQTYRQTVLTAFQDVENDLSNLRILAQQAEILAQAVRDAQRAVTITLNEYEAGTVAYTTVVTAQLTLLSDQESALTVQQNRLLASVALIQDMGGGFQASDLPTAGQIQAKLPFTP